MCTFTTIIEYKIKTINFGKMTAINFRKMTAIKFNGHKRVATN